MNLVEQTLWLVILILAYRSSPLSNPPFFPFFILSLEKYASALPPLPEADPDHKIEQSRLKEIRKKLEGHTSARELENFYIECLEHTVDLSTDFVGNVILQKLIDKCNDHHRLKIIEKLAPHMAAIGVHKNGTWVVQKVIDTARTTTQIHQIVNAVKHFTPPLLLDSFGNYVVQCCLRLGTHRNQFIFDAMHDECLKIALGRFGARSMRTCLESQYTTKRQQKHVAIALVQNVVKLATHANGSLLMSWLLDTSTLPGRFRVLAPKVAPHVVEFATHKLASPVLLKIGKVVGGDDFCLLFEYSYIPPPKNP